MIQRKQSIFLLIALIITDLLYFLPFCEFSIDKTEIYKMTVLGVTSLSDNTVVANTYPLLILVTIVSLVNLLTILLYKKRILQIRLTILNIILSVGIIALFFYFINIATKDTEALINYKISLIIPAINIILYLLAVKFIRSDENLIKSLDRIR